MPLSVKICGLTERLAVQEALKNGASLLGFVFYPPSPRHLSPEVAASLAAFAPDHVRTVAVFVNPTDDDIAAVLARHRFGMIQLHGTESPDRVAAVRQRFDIPVIKAVSVATAADIAGAEAYEDVAEMLLFDAKAPKSMAGALPGGNGLVFDWTLLGHFRGRKPWLLSGGLDVGNLETAAKATGARGVDVSSGVEDRPGQKSLEKIRDFLDVARRLPV